MPQAYTQPLAFKVYCDEEVSAFISGNSVYGGRHLTPADAPNKIVIPSVGATRSELIRIIAELYEHGRAVIYSHAFWRELNNPQLTFRLFSGWLIETYHLVGSTPRRMTQALPHQPDSPFKYLLAIHVTEEFDHEKFYGRALEILGYTPEFVRNRSPLPENDALVSIVRAIARQSPLGYALVGGFLESTRDDEATNRLNKMLISAGIPREAVASAQEHEDLDRKLGHRDLIEDLAKAYGPVRGADLSYAVGCVLLFVDGIVDLLAATRREYSDAFTLAYCANQFGGKDRSGTRNEAPLLMNKVKFADGKPEIEIGNSAYELPRSVHDRLRLLAKLSHNTWTDKDFSELLVVSKASGRSFLEALLDRGLIWYRYPAPLLDHTAEMRRQRKLATWQTIFEHWLSGVYGEEFWSWIQEPWRLDTEVVGWLMENYHYIRSAQDHMSAATSNCLKTTWTNLLAQHFAEEVNHYVLFGQGLMQSGVPRDILIRSRPLPSTAAMCAHLTDLALTDTVAYVLADQMLQSSATSAKRTNDAFYARLIDFHPSLAPAIQVFMEHDRIDSDLGHSSLFDPILQELDPFDSNIKESIVRAGKFAVTVCHYFRGIQHWYGDRGWSVEDRLSAYSRDDQSELKTQERN